MEYLKVSQSFLLLLCLAITTQGCLSSKKVNKLVNKYYEDEKPEIINTGYIAFAFDSAVINKEIVQTKKIKKSFLPLIFYYSWNYTFHSELNEAYLLSSLNKKLISYADSVGLRNRLNGGAVQLNWNTNPQNFNLTYAGSFIYLFFGALPLKQELQLDPASQYISVTYQVLRNGQKTEKRKLKIKNPAETVTPKSNGTEPSIVVGDYLATAERKMKVFSKEIIDQIMKEL